MAPPPWLLVPFPLRLFLPALYFGYGGGCCGEGTWIVAGGGMNGGGGVVKYSVCI